MSVTRGAHKHGGHGMACSVRERALVWCTGTISCVPMISPFDTALAGTNFGSEPPPIGGRSPGARIGPVLPCRVRVRVCSSKAGLCVDVHFRKSPSV